MNLASGRRRPPALPNLAIVGYQGSFSESCHGLPPDSGAQWGLAHPARATVMGWPRATLADSPMIYPLAVKVCMSWTAASMALLPASILLAAAWISLAAVCMSPLRATFAASSAPCAPVLKSAIAALWSALRPGTQDGGGWARPVLAAACSEAAAVLSRATPASDSTPSEASMAGRVKSARALVTAVMVASPPSSRQVVNRLMQVDVPEADAAADAVGVGAAANAVAVGVAVDC